MKVTGKPPSAAQSAETAKLGRPDGADKKAAKSGVSLDELGGSAKVDVSDRARDISRARTLATPDDSVDDAKVARLQKLIDDGKYKVDADAIADRLVDEHMKMTPS